MIPALVQTEQIPYLKEAVYFRRRRNDPITNPSLIQYDEKIKITNFLEIYNEIKDKNYDELSNDFLNKKLLNFYKKKIVTYFKKNNCVNNVFNQLSNTKQHITHALL